MLPAWGPPLLSDGNEILPMMVLVVRKHKEDSCGTKQQKCGCHGDHPDEVRWNPLTGQPQRLPLITEPLRNQDEQAQYHEEAHRDENGCPVHIRPPQDDRRAYRQ